MASTTSEPGAERLSWLETLLIHLPKEAGLPCPPPGKCVYPFANFVVDPDKVELYGSRVAAFNNQAEVIFGFGSRSAGTLGLVERGESIEGIVDVMRELQEQEPAEAAIIMKWAEDLIKAVEKIYSGVGVPLPAPCANPPKQARQKRVLDVDLHATSDREQEVGDTELDTPSESPRKKHKSENIRTPKGVALVLVNRKPRNVGRKAGNPGKMAIAELAVKYRTSADDKPYWGCAATQEDGCKDVEDKCSHFEAGNASEVRVLKHAQVCSYLKDELREMAANSSASTSLGAKLHMGVAAKDDDARSLSDQRVGNSEARSNSASSSVSASSSRQSTPSVNKQSTLTIDHDFTNAGANQRRDIIDHCIMRLLCVCGLPPTVVDHPIWKELMYETTKGGPSRLYGEKPSSSKRFVDNLIPKEAVFVLGEMREQILKEDGNSVTFDGTSTRNPESAYTFHITTPSNRRSYFVAGYEGSKEHHDAGWIKERIVKTVSTYGGPGYFSNICSDSTNVTFAARRTATAEMPVIIDTNDCCHHLHNTVKDITKIAEFKPMIKQLSKNIAYFSKSSFSKAQLKEAALQVGVTRSPIKIGKTRFATHYMAAALFEPHLANIAQLVARGIIKPKKNKEVLNFFRSKTRMRDYESLSSQYTAIVAPLARSIWSLESSKANTSDVFVFWLAIASRIRDLFKLEDQYTFTDEVRAKVTQIINTRYKAMIDNAQSDIYFTAFYLDPRYSHANVLKKPRAHVLGPTITLPTQAPGAALQAAQPNVPYVAAFLRAGTFIRLLLKRELTFLEENPDPKAAGILRKLVTIYGNQGVFDKLTSQLKTYARNEFPFTTSQRSNIDPYEWWQSLQDRSDADVLATLAVKIFAALINSMPDERTGSKMTWLNGPLRAKQQVQTLVRMIQIGQWYGEHLPALTGKVRDQRRRPVVRFRDMTKEFEREHPPATSPSNVFKDITGASSLPSNSDSESPRLELNEDPDKDDEFDPYDTSDTPGASQSEFDMDADDDSPSSAEFRIFTDNAEVDVDSSVFRGFLLNEDEDTTESAPPAPVAVSGAAARPVVSGPQTDASQLNWAGGW